MTSNATGMFATTYFTSTSDALFASGVLAVDVVTEGLGNVIMEGVAVVAVDALMVGAVMSMRRSGIVVGTGFTDCIVVLSAGTKVSSSMASQSNGQIPVL